MKQILIVKSGTLAPKDKEKLAKNGMLVIEHPAPSEVRIVTAANEIAGDEILTAICEGIKNANNYEAYRYIGMAIAELFADKKSKPTQP